MGLDCVQIPYNVYGNKSDGQANGCYINYLQMNGVIFVPVFNIKEDAEVIKKIESIFTKFTVTAVESNAIANDGRVLNCIAWNIKT